MRPGQGVSQPGLPLAQLAPDRVRSVQRGLCVPVSVWVGGAWIWRP